MRFICRRGEHDHVAGANRHERKAILGRVDPGNCHQRLAQTPDFDAQSRAMRFIGMFGAERAREQRGPWRVIRPRFG